MNQQALNERTELKNLSVFKAAQKSCIGPNPQIISYFWKNVNIFFRLFPIISISHKIFSIFFLTLEKIGIDEKVTVTIIFLTNCGKNCSSARKIKSRKHYKFLAIRPRICKLFSQFFSSHQNNFFSQYVRTIMVTKYHLLLKLRMLM